MAYSGSQVTQFAPWGGGMGVRPAFSAKEEASEVLGGAKRRENLEEVRRASMEALLRRRRREELEAERRKVLAGEAGAKNVDTILKKVFTIDAEIEKIHNEMIEEEIAHQAKTKKRRDRDKLAVMLLTGGRLN